MPETHPIPQLLSITISRFNSHWRRQTKTNKVKFNKVIFFSVSVIILFYFYFIYLFFIIKKSKQRQLFLVTKQSLQYYLSIAGPGAININNLQIVNKEGEI